MNPRSLVAHLFSSPLPSSPFLSSDYKPQLPPRALFVLDHQANHQTNCDASLYCQLKQIFTRAPVWVREASLPRDRADTLSLTFTASATVIGTHECTRLHSPPQLAAWTRGLLDHPALHPQTLEHKMARICQVCPVLCQPRMALCTGMRHLDEFAEMLTLNYR